MKRFLSYLMVFAVGAAGGGAVFQAYSPARAADGESQPTRVAANLEVQKTATGTPGLVGSSTIADLVERIDRAVVNIDTVARTRDPFGEMFFDGSGGPPGAFGEEKGVGSGFVIDPNGLIVTNNHVVQGASEIIVTTAQGKQFKGKVIGTDPSTDLAVVKVNAKGLTAVKFARHDKVRVGDWVVAIGSPLGLSHTVSVGIISALDRDVAITERGNFIQTDAAINPGNSGGPLLNMQGEVVGVNTAIAARGQGIGFAIPAWTAQNVVTQLRTKGKVERAYMGVNIQDIDPEEATGILVVSVLRNSPAAKAGLKNGDTIVAVDGKAVKTRRELLNYLADKAAGATIQVTVARRGGRATLPVKLEAMPERPLR